MKFKWGLGIGDWGLGIGDWAQSPIPKVYLKIKIKIYVEEISYSLYLFKIIYIFYFMLNKFRLFS